MLVTVERERRMGDRDETEEGGGGGERESERNWMRFEILEIIREKRKRDRRESTELQNRKCTREGADSWPTNQSQNKDYNSKFVGKLTLKPFIIVFSN